jgi:glycosyltransferase involved in cell wall biosynthesis
MTRARGRELSVLLLEPYYGGSHRSFLEGMRRLPFRFELMSLPPRKWKWRMRLAAPFFAQRLHESGKRYDRVLCSAFLDVAAFRALAPRWIREVPVLTYFHENQFAYPVQVEDERDLHFGLTNTTTALASDSLAFNSSHNLESFLEGVRHLTRHAGDMSLHHPVRTIRARSTVIPPGVDFSEMDTAVDSGPDDSPVIVWNHRWEHDKDPETFFQTLFHIAREGIDFKVIVLGQSFERCPAIFEEARRRLSGKLLHLGYVSSRRKYARWLRRGSIVASTARHEFFGMAVLEAVRARCRPLLPRRLSYPEMFLGEFLYDEGGFPERLRKELLQSRRLGVEEARRLTEPFSWDSLAPAYSSWIENAEVTGGG